MKVYSLILCLFTSAALADLNIDSANINENYSETVKASGKFYMGIQIAGKHDFDSFYVDIPSNSKGLLCISMASIDGIYKVQMQHPLNGQLSGMTKVNFLSKYEDKITDLKENELSVLARLGNSCNDQNAQFLFSSWSEKLEEKTPIVIIRSGARIDTAHIPNIENSQASFPCKRYKGTNTVTFDKYCALTGVKIEELATIEIARKNFKKIASKTITLSK